jgi:uncharacterized protein with NRDE domain
MCTLILLHRCFADAELLVAANRDESLDRPAELPALRAWNGRHVLAPRDARAGGTWLGLNDARLFAALTNRPTLRPDPSRRSRGLLVRDALAAPDAAAAATRLSALPAGMYNPFNLVVCDPQDAFVVVYEEKPDVRRLAAGPHVIGNGDPDSRSRPKLARLLDEAEAAAGGRPEQALASLARTCRTHLGGDPFEDTCIHAGSYGTRSSTLLRWGTGPAADVFRFSNGPPCESDYEDFTPLLLQLGRTGLRTGAATRDHA